jgi:hypothetical protein
MVRCEAAIVTLKRPRATGYYATLLGREYHATTQGSDVILRSYNGEPPPVDFLPSRITSVQGIRTVQRSDLENLSFVRTVCRWQGEPFTVVGVDDQLLYVLYTGERGEWIVQQPGMVRTGKLETHGRLEISQVDEIYEFVDPLPL